MPIKSRACTAAWTCESTSDVSAARRPLDQRYRYLYKPAIFLACLVPLIGCVDGIVGAYGYGRLPGFELGVDPVRYVLGVFGHTALNLLLITLTVTPLRQLTGNAHLLRVRRMLGVFAFSYALLHFLIYIGPYQGLSWDAITKDIVKRPYITIGFAALVMLLPLAITSTNGMMRRLGRRWQSLHRLIYPIAILGVWHYWWQVKKDIREPLLYAAILTLLLGWRLWRRQSRRAAATSKSELPKAQERA